LTFCGGVGASLGKALLELNELNKPQLLGMVNGEMPSHCAMDQNPLGGNPQQGGQANNPGQANQGWHGTNWGTLSPNGRLCINDPEGQSERGYISGDNNEPYLSNLVRGLEAHANQNGSKLFNTRILRYGHEKFIVARLKDVDPKFMEENTIITKATSHLGPNHFMWCMVANTEEIRNKISGR